MDNGFNQIKHVTLPVTGVRGVAVDPASASLFVSYYDKTGGASSPGWLLKYNLNTDTIVWNKRLAFTVDSPAISPDGTKIYMPESQISYSGKWHVLSASDGSSISTISIGSGYATHNTVVSLNGSHAYLGALNYNYLVQIDTATNQITKKNGATQSRCTSIYH
jgi:DNA-binding beta-propeller fold protein YncE